MTNFIRKTNVAIILSLLSIASIGCVYGEDYENSLATEERERNHSLEVEERENSLTCQPICCEPTCCGKIFINADFLYWKPHQEGFGCGCNPEINNAITDEGNVISHTWSRSKEPHFRWDPGYRIGVGYEFGNQCWDIAACWTHFHSHVNDHDDCESNHFRWKLNYDVIDVVFGRFICLDSFELRPFIGVRAARITQKVHSKSRSAFNVFETSSSSSFSSSDETTLEESFDSDFSDCFLAEEHNRQRFEGVGPVIGLEADWSIGCGWSLFVEASVASLYGHYDVRFHGFNSFLNGTNFCDKHGHLHSCQIATDTTLGIRWHHYFCNGTEVIFQLAAEQHRYFDHNHIGQDGDLCLDGGSFSVGLVF